MITDFIRTRRNEHSPLPIHSEAVECVEDVKFLRVNVSDQLTWTTNTWNLITKEKRRHFLRGLKKAQLPHKLMLNYYRSTIKNILTSSITVSYASGW